MSSGQSWPKKFAVAISGVQWSVRNQHSFWVHLPITVVVISLGAWLQIEACAWAAVVIAITIVISVELLNTSIEQLIKVLHPGQNERIGRSLDVAAGAVLVASVGAMVVGLIALAWPLWDAIASRM